MLISEWEGFVYILSGSFEEVSEKKGYRTWFRVARQQYLDQWEKAIQPCRQTLREM